MAQNILVVGKLFKRLTDYITEHGLNYYALVDTATHSLRDSHSVLCDFSSTESILKAADDLRKTVALEGVVATYENYILPAAQIAEHLGLPGLPVDAAKACTDKQLMRQLFAKAPQHISPDFAVVNSLEHLEEFADSHEFPLILKPANLAKSLLVTKNHDLTELLENYESTTAQIEDVYKKYAPHRRPKLLVEEFLEGSIHSVDAFIGQDGEPQVLEQVVDYQTGYDIGYDDNFHYSRLLPSKLPVGVVSDIRRVAALGCRSLGMKNSAAHIETILTKNGPKIVEIGARNGGYRERMHGVANGIDIIEAGLKLAIGQPFNIQATRNDSCAVLELFPKLSGEFAGISHQTELEQLPSLSYFNLKVKHGDLVGKAAHGHKMCAVIMLHNQDVEQFKRDLDFVNRHVYVETIS